jgi:hypothetical protein
MNRSVSFIIRVLKEDPLSPGILDVIVVVIVICLPYLYQDSGYGGFPPELTFSERVAEVRVSPKFFEILRIEMKNYSHHHKNGNVFNRTSMNIDLFNRIPVIRYFTRNAIIFISKFTSKKHAIKKIFK